jgi:serine/threonine protein kinase
MSERELFIAALKISDQTERSAWLDQECGYDAKMRQRIDVLLQAFEKAGSLLDHPAVVGETATQPSLHRTSDSNIEPCSEAPGTIIGRYKLLQQIGEGGMGTVFMAEQTEPVQRKVALKIIKAGMDSRQVIARFEAERQALALMDHPNIAKVHDAGITGDGRPYFVMELVKGLPITKYCDNHHLSLRQRLELFVPVCQAVQHAHQKGIIHRDLKPSNVLVAQYDGKPVPKVIDFGVAKAAGPKLTDRTLYTEFGAVVGTFEYMSPEQAELNQLDVDTRSDIYSLGVLLYELLTGTTPLERSRVKEAALLEVLRLIREEEPRRPSLRLSDLGRSCLPSRDNPATVPALKVGPTSSLASISALRQTEPAKLTKLMRGELDWIVMKALEKDRNRRYETANGFAIDVQRYLADEPVQACPPSVGYRFRKFARRNRFSLFTAALVSGSLLLGTAISIWQAVRATAAESLAQQRFKDEKEARSDAEAARIEEAAQRNLADERRDEADKQRRRAEASFLLARKAVDEMYTEVAERWLNQPTLEPLQRDFIAKALHYYQEFAQVREGNAAIRWEAVQASRRVGAITRGIEQSSEPTIRAYWQASAILDDLAKEFPREPRYFVAQAEVQVDLAVQLSLGGKRAAAMEAGQRAIRILEELAGQYPDVPDYRLRLSRAHAQSHSFLERQPAERALRESIRICEKLASESPKVPDYWFELANSYRILANVQLDGLRQVLSSRKAIEFFQKVEMEFPTWPTPYPTWRTEMAYDLAGSLNLAEQPQEAIACYRQAVDGFGKLVTAHPNSIYYNGMLFCSGYNLTKLLGKTGRHEEVENVYRPLVEQYERLIAVFPNHDEFMVFGAAVFNHHAWILANSPDDRYRDPKRAVELAKKAVELTPKAALHWNGMMKQHLTSLWWIRDIEPKLGAYSSTLGAAQYRAGDWKAAVEALTKSNELLAEQVPGSSAFFLAMAHWQLGKKEEARNWYNNAVKWMEMNQPKNEELGRFRQEAESVLELKK